ncbi:MAG: GNAT family N-acetyltransferase [Pirellulaceae bacterium]
MNVVIPADEISKRHVAEWVTARVENFDGPRGSYQSLGVVDKDRLIAGAVYTDYRERTNLFVTFAADSPRWATRGNIYTILGWPFDQLGCERLSALVVKKNKRSRKLLEGLGFVLEGTHPGWFGPGTVACSYGLLRQQFMTGRFHG